MSKPSVFVFDVEWTAWEGSRHRHWTGPGEKREIVQIGIIKLDDDPKLTETDALEIYVKPEANPILSDYFIDLTGISQETVDRMGTSFAEGLEHMAAFLGDDVAMVCSHGDDDFNLKENCGFFDLKFPFVHINFRNVRPDFARFLGVPEGTYDSCHLAEPFGYENEGRDHNALADCRVIAHALRVLRENGLF